jgi:hypothetical protein
LADGAGWGTPLSTVASFFLFFLVFKADCAFKIKDLYPPIVPNLPLNVPNLPLNVPNLPLL